MVKFILRKSDEPLTKLVVFCMTLSTIGDKTVNTVWASRVLKQDFLSSQMF